MKLRFKKLNNTGDTIVEVLIVLAILSLALSIGYATANRGLQKSRNAQEHSQALGIINSQVELLRSSFAKQNGAAIEAQAASGPFCLSPSGMVVSITPLANAGPNKFDENVAVDKLNNTSTYPGPCIQNTLYNISIVGRGGGVYDFRVRWEGFGGLGRQQAELTYKIGNVTVSPTGGYTDPELPPPPPAPSLVSSLTANGSTGTINITAGTAINLQWSSNPSSASCTGSGSVSVAGFTGAIPDHGSVTQGTTLADSGKTYTYTLTCTLLGASDTHTVTVKLAPYAPDLATLYRSYAGSFVTDHFYSLNATEAIAPNGAYSAQGNVGKVDRRQGPGEIPLYRLYSPSAYDHLYTTSTSEISSAQAIGFSYEGIIGYIFPYTGSCPTGTKPLYRLFSYSLSDHFYTTSFQEYSDGRDEYGARDRDIRPGGPYIQPEGVTGCVYN